jgi:hypothetical protein
LFPRVTDIACHTLDIIRYHLEAYRLGLPGTLSPVLRF